MHRQIISTFLAIGITIAAIGYNINAQETDTDISPETGDISVSCYIVPAVLAIVTIAAKKTRNKK